MRKTLALLILPLSLLLALPACGGADECPAGSTAVGARCVANDAGANECPAGTIAVGASCVANDAGDLPDARVDGAIDLGVDACVATGVEVCNGIDDNCDGTIDEGFSPLTHYADADGDLFGDDASLETSCSIPAGRILVGGDCDDTNAAVHPGVVEVCNGLDDDCDDAIDEGVTSTFYADADSDGYGALASPLAACTMPTGAVANSGDCDDSVASTHPSATETCNAVDDDCDAALDDGFACVRGASGACIASCGTMGTGICTNACTLPTGSACTPPAESCNFIDDDCDGAVDEALGSLGTGTAHASAASLILLPTTDGFVAVYTTASGIYARSFGATTGAGTAVQVTPTVPTAFDAATNGDDLIIAWSIRATYQLYARRYVANTLAAYGGELLLRTADDFTFFSEIAMAMNATQVLIAMSQPSAIGFVRCSNTLASVATGTIRTTADDDLAKLDLVADPAGGEWLLANENGGALSMQFVTAFGAAIGTPSALGAAGGTEVALALGPTSPARVFGAAFLQGTTLRFARVSATGTGSARTPTLVSGPTDVSTSAQRIGAAAPLLDAIDLALSGGRWFASYFSGASASASRIQLATSAAADGTVFTSFASPDPVAGVSRRASAVVGTAGNHVLLGSQTTVWRVGCP